MILYGSVLALIFIVIVARLLILKYNPQAVLLFSGLFMLIIALLLGFKMPILVKPTGSSFLNIFEYIKVAFSETNAQVGLLIMAIGGFVAFIEKNGASDALVYLALKPLSLMKKYPYIIASLVIPIGQFLFICIPSAAGLSLLLMASVFPIMVNLGVSRLSAVSVITATTAFGVGPASVITARSVKIIDTSSVSHFFDSQIPLMVPLTITLMICFFFVNRYFDKKENSSATVPIEEKEIVLKVPLYYAILPILPLIILLVFSEMFSFFETPIHIDTTTVMIICVFIGLLMDLIRTRNLKMVFESLQIFFNGMGDIFKSVVTLIIAAEMFSKGLISLLFIDGLITSSQSIGLGGIGISIVMAVMIFFASVLMGSGNAAFFAFGPLVPKITNELGVSTTSMILPMEFSASMGRTVSPISGVLIASSNIAKVSPFDIAKRNAIPFGITFLVMIIIHFIL
ncbi:C4-dicarboxylate transporter DcuC [Flavobacterium sp. IMCC34518]|uniref:C4-dicarboxylate transporter DcuC n=1 Tax=Flavobacterium sp. IMCC34518 TaxID=3003623 RepID=UPI0022AC5543|nr:C4-dicarboxylate transporter DcuC [Flavobacterium sp. IMCC34518]